VPARVVSVEYQGTSVHVGFEADGLGGSGATALTAVIDDGAYAGHPLALGQTVPLGWDAAAAHRLSA
jgi:putative spermidine/putrescine transport system ATP-binding protein